MSDEGASDPGQARVLEALRRAHQRLDDLENERSAPVAVVGIGCRFPGDVSGPESFWQLLTDGVDAVQEVPAERWNINEWYDPDPDAPGKMYTRQAGFIDGVADFEPEFFRISPREALKLDPQQRLLLEVCWEAIEHAGINPETLRGSMTGFYMGLSWHDYERNSYGMDAREIDAYSGMGNTPSIAVGRLAFTFGAHGPTAQVDTACSASLTSVHFACQALQRGDASMMLAGGVNLMISPLSTVFCSKIKALAPDGRCKTFDESADGYGRGEGCGVVVLKRLSDAVRDGDNVLAVIRGTAINHDGPSSGLTVPSRSAQTRVIKSALAVPAILPSDVSYIEAHGTGTALGDPIEIGALCDALGDDRDNDQPLYVGSVKTNIGHLEAAAGIAGLIKTVLSINNGLIPPHLHVSRPSSRIDWDEAPIRIPTELTPWPKERRIAGTSSFGFSGTNAHVILEDYVRSTQQSGISEDGKRDTQLLCLSARTEPALREMAARYAIWLSGGVEVLNLADVCYTANTGRARFSERLFVVDRTVESLSQRLQQYAESGKSRGLVVGGSEAAGRPRVAFLFTGQGSQWLGMGKDLYETQPVFREELRRCEALLRDDLEQPLSSVMFGGEGMEGLLDETRYTQPALFALEWSLAKLWQSWGIEPTLVMGHSVGEYVAACLSGVFSLEDGLRLIAARGRLMQQQPPDGSMVAVMASEARVRAAVSGYEADVSVAGVNGPSSIVVSGRRDKVEECLQGLREEGVKLNELVVSHAFHSPLMDPMLDEFEAVARGVRYSAPRLMLVSNVSGALAGEEVCSARYWREHVREAVNFVAGMRTLEAQGVTTYVEVGPSPVLLGMGRACVEEDTAQWVNSLRRNESGCSQMQAALGQLWLDGHKVQWSGYEAGQRRHRVAAPTYPFQRKRFWVEPKYTNDSDLLDIGPALSNYPLLGRRLTSSLLKPGEKLYESEIGPQSPKFLAEHKVFNQLVPPATFYHELALEAAVAETGKPCALNNVVVQSPMILSDQKATIVQCLVARFSEHNFSYRISSYRSPEEGSAGQWTLHSTGEIVQDSGDSKEILKKSDKSALRNDASNKETGLDSESIYQYFAGIGLDLGPTFKTVKGCRLSGNEFYANISLPQDMVDRTGNWQFHPGLMDGIGQTVGVALSTEDTALFLPIAVDSIVVLTSGITQASLYGSFRDTEDLNSDIRIADIDVYTQRGNLAVQVRGLTLKATDPESIKQVTPKLPENSFYKIAWQPARLEPVANSAAQSRCWLIVDVDDNSEKTSLTTVLNSINHDFELLSCENNSLSIAAISEKLEKLTNNSANEFGGIVFLSARLDREGNSQDPIALAYSMCVDLLHTVQSLSNKIWTVRPRLVYVTRGVQFPGKSSDAESLAGSCVSGLLANASVEHPDIDFVHLDLEVYSSGNDARSAAREILTEVFAEVVENRIAFQAGRRMVGRIAEFETDSMLKSVPSCKDVAAYVVTGGLGGLGLATIEWLINNGAKYICAFGRSEPSTIATVRIDQLQRDGVVIETAICDVSDFSATRDALNNLLSRSGRKLCGIVHLAGVLQDGMLATLSDKSFATVMQPKVAGTWNLHLLSLAQPLDFFITSSSAAAFIGSAGQGNYAAANAFLSGISKYRQSLGLPSISVGFGPWEDLGMTAAMDDSATRRMMNLGWSPLRVEDLGKVFDNLLRIQSPDVALLPLDWAAFMKQFSGESIPTIFSELDIGIEKLESTADLDDSDLLQTIRAANPSNRKSLVKEFVVSRVRGVLELASTDSISNTSAFGDLGIDSLMHMELRSAVTKPLGLSISVGDFIAQSNVTALTELIAEKLVTMDIQNTTDLGDDADIEEFII